MFIESLFRLIYSFTAIGASVEAFWTARVYRQMAKRPELKVTNGMLDSYILLRVGLGALQLPLHLFILLPSRYIPAWGDWFLQTFLHGDRWTFYVYLHRCNYALFTMVYLSLVFLHLLRKYYPRAKSVASPVMATTVVWSVVWCFRVFAWMTWLERYWFKLAWPVIGLPQSE